MRLARRCNLRCKPLIQPARPTADTSGVDTAAAPLPGGAVRDADVGHDFRRLRHHDLPPRHARNRAHLSPGRSRHRPDGVDRAVRRDAVVLRGDPRRSLRPQTDHLDHRTLLHRPHLVHRAFERRGLVYDFSKCGPDIPRGRVRRRGHDDQRGVSRRTARARDRGAAHGCVSRRDGRGPHLRAHGGVAMGLARHVPARDRAAGDGRVSAARSARDRRASMRSSGRGRRRASRVQSSGSRFAIA